MSAGEWVVAIVLALTLAAVLWYAHEARKQAAASAKMAEEMRQQRRDAARPVINIGLEPYERDWEGGLKQALEKAFPAAIQCQLRNIGVGPALNVRFQVDDGQGRSVLLEIGALEAREGDQVHRHLTVADSTVDQEGKLLQVFYEDVFGNTVESRRDLSLGEDGGLVIGPLRILVSGHRAK
jgi:hypothetical protein